MINSIVGAGDLKITDELKRLIETKTHKMDRLLKGQIHINWRILKVREKFVVKVHVSGRNFYKSFSSESKSLRTCIDLALKLLERELSSTKDELSNKLHRPSVQMSMAYE